MAISDIEYRLCPEKPPAGMVKYIREKILPEDNFFIYKRGNVKAVHTACKNKIDGRKYNLRFRQNYNVQCPICGKRATCVLETGVSYAADYLTKAVSTIQRGKDGKTIFLRQWRIRRDPDMKYSKMGNFLEETARYAIRGKDRAKWQKDKKQSYMGRAEIIHFREFERARDAARIHEPVTSFFLPREWRRMVKDTSLQYIDLDEYIRDANPNKCEPIRFCLFWANHPAVEMLRKAGYKKLVEEYVWSGTSGHLKRAVRWSKTDIRKATGMNFGELRIKDAEDWRLIDLLDFKELKEKAQKGLIRKRDIQLFIKTGVRVEDIEPALTYASAQRILKYLGTQTEAAESVKDLSHEYKDYMWECAKLGLNLSDKSVLFPRDLNAAHMRNMQLVEYENNLKRQKQFDGRVKELKRFEYKKDGLLIRPALSAAELKYEGEKLKHCVAGYASDMACGNTTIFFIRREAEKDKPYYTLEYKYGRVFQCRTKNNQSYEREPEIAAFVAAWLEHIEKKKLKISKKKTA